MTVHQTNKWLEKYIKSQSEAMTTKWQLHQNIVCKPLVEYFNNQNVQSIQDHLLRHGLFLPSSDENEIINNWLQKNYHQLIDKLYQKFRKSWKGPSAEIFIFPSNHHSQDLMNRFSGCTGLSYPKQLFLFLSHQAKLKQVVALFLHEYSHTCRLHHFLKPEDEYTLLDAIILEGIAEHLVRTILGKEFGNQWIDQYSETEAKKYFEKWIKSNLSIKRNDPKHDFLMYGNKYGIPQNLGYHIGYYILQQYTKDKRITAKEILYIKNEDIISNIDLLD